MKETDNTQKIETNSYAPTYRIKPEFRKALLEAIGDYPHNQVVQIFNALDVETIDHQTLTQLINTLGQVPYLKVEKLMRNLGSLIEQVIED